MPAVSAAVAENNISSLKDKRILVVDDDSTQLTLMKELLGNYAAYVRTEINPSAIIPVLEKDSFDIVLTDIQMPSMDGFEVLAAIRQHADPFIKVLPVIALSGRRDLTEDDFLGRGFTAHHPKPIQFEELLELLKRLFGDKIQPKPKTEARVTSGKPYSLESLSQFTNNDPDSLRTIILTFTASAKSNCEELADAALNSDGRQLAETAHRMIPMLKQMEVNEIAALLIPLEDKSIDIDWSQMPVYVQVICEKMDVLCRALEKEVA